MVVVRTRPLNVPAGQSCGQVRVVSLPVQVPSPQRETGDNPGVPVEATKLLEGELQEARIKINVIVKIQERLISLLVVTT
jgi:hypothetical protein